jgi:hypothetical protein
MFPVIVVKEWQREKCYVYYAFAFDNEYKELFKAIWLMFCLCSGAVQ